MLKIVIMDLHSTLQETGMPTLSRIGTVSPVEPTIQESIVINTDLKVGIQGAVTRLIEVTPSEISSVNYYQLPLTKFLEIVPTELEVRPYIITGECKEAIKDLAKTNSSFQSLVNKDGISFDAINWETYIGEVVKFFKSGSLSKLDGYLKAIGKTGDVLSNYSQTIEKYPEIDFTNFRVLNQITIDTINSLDPTTHSLIINIILKNIINFPVDQLLTSFSI